MEDEAGSHLTASELSFLKFGLYFLGNSLLLEGVQQGHDMIRYAIE